MMKQTILGNTGIKVSRAGFGVLPMGPSQLALPVEEGAAVLRYALERGFNFVDTAQYYRTYPYIRRALDFVAGLIPPEKLLLGISGCGFDWTLPWHSGDRAQQISNLLATERAMAMGREIHYEERAGTAYYDYTDPAAKRHRVYFEDARSISEKSALVEEYSLAGISLYSWETCLRGGYSVIQRLYNAEKLL